LLKPAIFFENIDGEAIMWAEAQLRAQDAEQRCLIVVSDGAPVDDSTLSENGPNFLWNHLVQTIADVGARGEVAIGAVGIDHRVETLYPASRHVEAGTTGALVAAIGAVAAELLSPSD
jgi:cobaltochelatase CobT